MIGDDHALIPGYVARHVPPGSEIGIDVAVPDIAQDFLLAHLAERGVLRDLVIFKGGTALRKSPVGAQGRFSTEMDLASREHRRPTVTHWQRSSLAKQIFLSGPSGSGQRLMSHRSTQRPRRTATTRPGGRGVRTRSRSIPVSSIAWP